MNKTLKTLAAAVLLGSTALAPMAMAQTGTTTNPSAPAMDAPAATAPSAQSPAMNDAAPAAKPMTPVAGDSAAASGTYLTEQSETQISANTYIGQNVYNAADEDIGSITDLIFEKDGGVVAAIVGVGGFLGIGEKNVAVPMEKITVNREGDGDDLKLTTVETAESLKSAPEYRTISEQRAEAGANTGTTGTVMPTDNSTTSSTTKP
ncbi:PRC-barrel domain-containing protein [Rhizobium sp. RU36D]|uniref:PRC-barrel domain-containing protein n=1 Tax=Rhizobium sp. RU36D TaxID=1907415 RepID=UPI0009D87C03|nr:PRC-barrel domain-containing protein [Rhizobium sp. RU36D]SMC92574.1 Sporulation protein YlmC, PRC-barrel domain family [Rhizobium sp. RU36D]